MNIFLTILVSILEIIVILGVLISLHEAGHLATAKLFNVYCFEYSIGFGPKLFKKKRKRGETFFCISALPLGGYVSMYGEEDAVPDGYEDLKIDPSRALPNKPKWQQAIIMVAGVTVNFILGLILIFVSDIAFPVYRFGYGAANLSKNTDTVVSCYVEVKSYGQSVIDQINAGIAANPALEGYVLDDFVLAFPCLYQNEVSQVIYLADEAHIENNPSQYVTTYYPNSLIDVHSLADSVLFYESVAASAEDPNKEAYDSLDMDFVISPQAIGTSPSVSYYNVANATDGTKATFEARLIGLKKVKKAEGEPPSTPEEIKERYLKAYHERSILIPIELTAKGGKWTIDSNSDIRIDVVSEFFGWNGAWGQWAKDVPSACGAIVQGLGSLFTGGWKNLSGIVGMTAALPSMTARGGTHQIFFFAGLLSINLAFFNLLPFPGLDGWQLVSIGFEAITRKKIPLKVKSIISMVGMGLLFLLVIAITVKDIIMLF